MAKELKIEIIELPGLSGLPDRLEAPSIDLNTIDSRDLVTVSITINDTAAATAANYGVFFIAPISYEVLEVWESHKVAGNDAGAVTVDIEKLTSGQALDGGVSMLATTLSLKSTANTPVRVFATTTTDRRFLKPGDRMALDDTGTLTAVSHVAVTVLLRKIQTQVSLTI